MTRALAVSLAVALLAGTAEARPEFWDLFRKHYSLKSSSDSAKAQCMNCHTVPPQHNPYGAFLKQAMKLQGTPGKLTDRILAIAESQDSDGDGWTNGEETMAGFNAGDPKSHPTGSPPHKVATEGGAPIESPLLPRHTFHPVIVHFPIALFLFGAFLEFLGKYRRDDVVRNVAFWNLAFGTVATLVAIPTGFIAAYRLGYPLTVGAPVFIHLAFGISAGLLMLSVVLWRRTAVLDKTTYWILLSIAAATVGVAGHFGGQMVYG